ncbi:MAG: copper chaperone PCu(A)C [Myxococcota bacterium]
MKRSATCLLALLVSLLGAVAPASAADPLEVRDAWIRQPPPGTNAAAYMTLHNPGTEALRVVGVHSPAAERTELHRSVVEDGVARMRPVEAIEVPAGGSVELAPRGLHLMLIRPRALRLGETVGLTLELDGGGSVVVQALVRSAAHPAAGHSGGHH